MTVLRSDRGFTIIESMVALLILSVGMLAVGTMLNTSLQTDRFNLKTRRGEEGALKIIEKFKAGNPDSLAVAGSDTDSADFYYKWTTRDHESGLKEFQIVVGWGGGTDCSESTPEKCRQKIKHTNFVQL
jgi:prepilin-type N-terminal cleavage/methylation domain-containing protein